MTYCKYISYNLYYSNIVNMFIALLFYRYYLNRRQYN